jgi:hypothetical protein
MFPDEKDIHEASKLGKFTLYLTLLVSILMFLLNALVLASGRGDWGNGALSILLFWLSAWAFRGLRKKI